MWKLDRNPILSRVASRAFTWYTIDESQLCDHRLPALLSPGTIGDQRKETTRLLARRLTRRGGSPKLEWSKPQREFYAWAVCNNSAGTAGGYHVGLMAQTSSFKAIILLCIVAMFASVSAIETAPSPAPSLATGAAIALPISGAILCSSLVLSLFALLKH
ncbi:hypothetical protein NE237_009278 [Protea cynaroides]|uniref:Uncharacterized protein n=1 Tax=Protea cynaroides TaxID=273540 RepID=A0A9Q0KX94_9MAGN|nr:hypothetical protein NE237_009278 [Protea cynaroides]